MEVYPDGYAHCFGCGAHVAVKELDTKHEYVAKIKHVENVQEKLAYISSLPCKEIRGLLLPYDTDSYYIVWPERDYYNQRFFNPTGVKYKLPSGHSKRPLWVRNAEGASTLVVVEGEINALSVGLVTPASVNVVSPGGAGDFYAKTLDKYLPLFSQYAKLVLLADKDRAGAMACIQLKSNLLALGAKNVHIHLMEQDANAILMLHGHTALAEEIQKALEMP